jgi:hypothetical protein
VTRREAGEVILGYLLVLSPAIFVGLVALVICLVLGRF